jgi:transcriptional repressor NrdR
MICPKCNNKNTRVLDSRVTDSDKAIRRRRECADCKFRFTTFERMEAGNFIVAKKDGTREPYDREKLKRGIWRACEKRKITDEQVENALNQLETAWANHGKEITTDLIGEDVMDTLRDLDDVAYIRFASVYRQFQDLESFKKELQKLLP